MAIEPSSTPARKHRVVALGTDPSGPRSRSLSTGMRITLGVAALLLAAFTVRAVIVYRAMQQEEADLSTPLDPSTAFADRSRAEGARQAAVQALEAAAKLPSQHPVALRMMVDVERLRDPADKAFGDRDYPRALRYFEEIARRARAYASTVEDMRLAQEGYTRFLLALPRAEKFKHLAPQPYERALAAAGASQQFQDQGSFTQARRQVEEAIALLDSMEQSIKAELEIRLAEGRSALSRGAGTDAQAAFRRCLDLHPGHPAATAGLTRAQTIDTVFARLAEAEALENAGRLEEARDTFAKTFSLDAQSAAAQAGLARTRAAIQRRDFEAALARAAAAESQTRWSDAIAAYLDAQKIDPGATDIAGRLTAARASERQQRIQTMLTAAYALEGSYSWNEARRAYLDVLAFQPGQSEAEEGLLRAGRVTRAMLKFERLLDEARSLADRAEFQSAIAAFNEAMANKPSYLELQPDQVELRDRLEAQSRPVSLTFVSDGKTWVTITGVQLIGRFASSKVNLLPGNYEIIGRRKGYADVRETLRVRAGQPVDPITIIATRKAAK